jgi:hypothetical protein
VYGKSAVGAGCGGKKLHGPGKKKGGNAVLNRFRKLPVRYEKKARNYRTPAEWACAVIIWRNLIPIHPGFISG